MKDILKPILVAVLFVSLTTFGDSIGKTTPVKWKVDLPHREKLTALTPVVENGSVYLAVYGKNRTNIFLINGTTGKIEKTIPLGGKIIYTLAVYKEGFAVGTNDKRVYLFKKNGQLVKTFTTDGYPVGITAVNVGNLTRTFLAVLDDTITLYLLDAQSGLPIWKFEDGDFDILNGPPAVGYFNGKQTFVVGGWHYIWKVSTAGNLLGKIYVEKLVYKSPVVCDFDGDGNDEVAAAVAQNVLILNDGEMWRKFTTDGDKISLASYRVGKVKNCFIAASDEEELFYIYSPLDDRMIKTLRVENGKFLPPAVVRLQNHLTAVVTATTTGTLFVLNGGTGKVLFKKRLNFKPVRFTLGDFDRNGFPDLIFVTASGQIICEEIPLKVEKFIWIPPYGNPQNTNRPAF